jgi:hypothetical protein
MEARYAASGRGSSPHWNARDVFGGVSGEVCADSHRRVFGNMYVENGDKVSGRNLRLDPTCALNKGQHWPIFPWPLEGVYQDIGTLSIDKLGSRDIHRQQF